MAYLRPETAQAIFAQFKNVVDTSRQQVPFGIAQIGKAFRNEINPRNFTFRSREFEQMELEFFIRPDEVAGPLAATGGRLACSQIGVGEQWHKYWVEERACVKYEEQSASAATRWIFTGKKRGAGALRQARTSWTSCSSFLSARRNWRVLPSRGDFDLKQHQEHSGKSMEYFDEGTAGRGYKPHVIERQRRGGPFKLSRASSAMLITSGAGVLPTTKANGNVDRHEVPSVCDGACQGGRVSPAQEQALSFREKKALEVRDLPAAPHERI